MEEDLRSQEAFIPNINIERLQKHHDNMTTVSMVTNLLSDAIHALIYLEPLIRFLVILGKLLGNIGTDVTEFLLEITCVITY